MNLHGEVKPLSTVNYTAEGYYTFEKKIVKITMSVSFDHNGSKHGYSGLVKDDAVYEKLVKDPSTMFTP